MLPLEGHKISPHVPTVHTKPVSRDKRPNLEAKSRPSAQLNCFIVIMAFGSKISVELLSCFEDVRLSLALPVLL